MFLRHPLLSLVPNHLIFYPTPANLTYFWGFGSLAGIFLVCQILTGVFLAMHYTPHIDLAFASVEHIMRDVNHGWLVRYLHANGASFFFFVVYLHIGRSLYFGFFNASRKLLWFSGILIFVLMMAIAFMGYVLPWGQMSFWGATVITNLFTALPFIGEPIAYWLWGGFSVGNATLTRFFSLHYLLPFVLVGLICLHLLFLHQNGSHNPLSINQQADKIPFYPYFYVKDYFGLMICFFLFFFIVTYYPDMLGHPDNYIEANALVTPAHIVPEWYFLPFYAILRSVPNKLGGVVAMGLAIAILAILPFYRVTNRSFFHKGRLFYIWSFWLFAFTVIFLGYLGGQPIEEPYTLFSQLLTFYYFSFFAGFVILDYIASNYFYYYNFQKQEKYLSTALVTSSEKLTDNKTTMGFLFFSKGLTQHVSSPTFLAWLALTLTNYRTTFDVLSNQYNVKVNEGIKNEKVEYQTTKHPFHLVNESPWPFLVSFSLFAVTVGMVMWFHRFALGETTVSIGLVSFIICLLCWFRDIIREATFEWWHTSYVQRGLKIGMILFILSEVMFFFSFFWGFFHSSLAPAIQIGGIWPPQGIEVFNPWEVPLLNTLILLTSGATVTWAHFGIRASTVRFLTKGSGEHHNNYRYWLCWDTSFSLDVYRNLVLGFDKHLIIHGTRRISYIVDRINFACIFAQKFVYAYKHQFTNVLFNTLMNVKHFGIATFGDQTWLFSRWTPRVYAIVANSRFDVLVGLALTIVLGVVFTVIQFYEYQYAPFTISDSIYGSTFFLTTGFHGLHVLIGTIFLLVCFFRMWKYHFTRTHHVGLESAIWYWHFVDVVWLGLYISIYHWGGAIL